MEAAFIKNASLCINHSPPAFCIFYFHRQQNAGVCPAEIVIIRNDFSLMHSKNSKVD
jgi:hypothetical protein